MHECDILVVGGGPAGLLAGSHLAQKYRVALIDRGTLGQTRKFWMTSESRLRKHALEQCVLCKPLRMTLGTFLGGQLVLHGDFAIVDDQRLLQLLIERCRDRDVHLAENCSLLNLSWTKERVRAQTSGDTFVARLVIDASGGMSPIASTFRLHDIEGYYSIYGSLLQDIKLHTQDLVLAYVHQLGHPPPILELYPLGDRSAYCVIFIYSKALVLPHTLAQTFDSHCQYNPFFQMTPETRRIGEKFGVIPLGRLRRRKLNGVIAIGEAGLIQPPLTGAAFNLTLEYSDMICDQISRALDGTDGLPRISRISLPLGKRAEDRLQLMVMRALVRGNIEVVDRILRILDAFPEEVALRFLGHGLSWSQLSQVAMRFFRG